MTNGGNVFAPNASKTNGQVRRIDVAGVGAQGALVVIGASGSLTRIALVPDLDRARRGTTVTID